MVLLSIYLIILLLFVAFGVDAAFSYKYNQLLGISKIDGLAICSGFMTSHVLPVFFTWPYVPEVVSISNCDVFKHDNKIVYIPDFSLSMENQFMKHVAELM